MWDIFWFIGAIWKYWVTLGRFISNPEYIGIPREFEMNEFVSSPISIMRRGVKEKRETDMQMCTAIAKQNATVFISV